MGEHYFFMRSRDDSKTYSPESQVVFDIPTAVAFFGQDARAATLERVHQMAQTLVTEWNKHFAATNPKVSSRLSFFSLRDASRVYRLNGICFACRTGKNARLAPSIKN